MNARRGDIGCLRSDGAVEDWNRSRQRALFGYLPGGRQDLFRNMLVQQRLGSADTRVRMEASAHRIVMQSIVIGEERHPLVMHHVTTNDDSGRSAGFGPSGVVD